MEKYRFTDCVDIVGNVCKPFEGSKKYVSTGAVENDHIVESDIVIVEFKSKPSRANLTAESGDILFAKMMGTKKTLLLDDISAQNVYSTGFCAVRAKEDILSPCCLYHLLSSTAFLEQKDKNCSGATQKAITNAGLDNIIISLPKVDEQDAITHQLNKIVAIIHMRQKEIQKLDDLIKARFVEMFGDPEFNTFGWDTEELGTLCDVGSSKRIYQNEQSQEGVPFWRISDLISKMDIGVADSGLFIPEERYVELKNAGLVPTTGDILVTSRGTLGRCYIIKDEDKFYFQDGMISWLSSYVDGITPLYLQYLFTMPGFRKQIDGMQAGSTVEYLSIAMLKKLRVMVPPIETQNCFALFVEQLDKSKAAVQKSLDKLQTLFDKLMQEYFG